MANKTIINGVLPVFKPPGPTSHDIVAHLRRLLQPKPYGVPPKPSAKGNNLKPRIGHSGTLDPFAAGLLLIALGQATRLLEYSHAWDKTYAATFILGSTSDTDDLTGNISPFRHSTLFSHSEFEIRNFKPTPKPIQSALTQFIGTIQQTPPAYSAIKIKGQKAYDLARAGQTLVLKPRPVTIHAIQILSYNYPRLKLKITCGTGTYIRSIARDLGQALGIGAYVQQLERTKIGPFSLADTVKLANLSPENLTSFLKPASLLVNHLPHLILNTDESRRFLHGQLLNLSQAVPQNQPLAVFGPGNHLLGTAISPGQSQLQPQKILLS
jgi:tRNA pseudouridine55 synthase